MLNAGFKRIISLCCECKWGLSDSSAFRQRGAAFFQWAKLHYKGSNSQGGCGKREGIVGFVDWARNPFLVCAYSFHQCQVTLLDAALVANRVTAFSAGNWGSFNGTAGIG